MVYEYDWRKKKSPRVYICKEGFEFYNYIAAEFLKLASYCLGLNQYFHIILGGGKTPKAVNRRIVDLNKEFKVDWSKVIIFFSDERCVPSDHPDSNYKMIFETLIKPLAIPENNVYRFYGELGPDEAAKKYQQQLINLFGYEESPVFDLALLGLGPDGHTASLFPNNESLTEKYLWSVPAGVGPEGWERVSLTYSVINSSKNVWFMANGIEKGYVINKILTGSYDPLKCPAQGVCPTKGNLVYILDKVAASKLVNSILI